MFFQIAEVTSEVTVEFSDCYEEETDDDQHYYYPRVRTFRDLTGIVYDHKNNETYEVEFLLTSLASFTSR